MTIENFDCTNQILQSIICLTNEEITMFKSIISLTDPLFGCPMSIIELDWLIEQVPEPMTCFID